MASLFSQSRRRRPAWRSDTPEDELVTAAVAGDSRALTPLFQQHDDRLRAFVYGLVPKDAGFDDVMQEVYLKAMRSLSTFRRASSFKTWLHSVAYSVVLDHSRKVIPLAAPQELFEDQVSRGASTEEQVTTQISVTAALQELSPRQRAAVLLVDGHGFDQREVGAVLGIATGTVGVHLQRGREAMKQAMSEGAVPAKEQP